MIVGGLLIGVLWFRPEGILPERKARFPNVTYKRRREVAEVE